LKNLSMIMVCVVASLVRPVKRKFFFVLFLACRFTLIVEEGWGDDAE